MFLLLIVTMAALSSCNKKSETGVTSVSVADLPLKASQYIDTNYPDASVLYVVALKQSSASYIVTLNTTEELAFTSVGDFLGDGAKFHGGHHGGEGDTTHCGDTIHGGGHHGGGHGGGPHENGIPIDSLSSTIKAYIQANFAAYTIKHAELDLICPEGLVTEVVIIIAGQEPVKLYFDAAKSYLLQDARVLYTSVPQAVQSYITANYHGYSTCNRATKYTMADNSLQFLIYLHLNQTRKVVRLKADGTLVCEK